jgi:hypothetical protein
MWKTRSTYRIFVRKYVGKCPVSELRRRWGGITLRLTSVMSVELGQDFVQWCSFLLALLNLWAFSVTVLLNPLKPSDGYMYHLFYKSITLHFVFMGLV